jgi:hypothetical protein
MTARTPVWPRLPAGTLPDESDSVGAQKPFMLPHELIVWAMTIGRCEGALSC